jgi:hypothetical protein
VRHVSVGADGIRRLGVEFLDRQAPDRLVATVEPEGSAAARHARNPEDPTHAAPPARGRRRAPTSADATRASASASTSSSAARDRRARCSRKNARFADNVGRQGVRVMTTMSSLSPGDVVSVEEVGGSFRTRAVVRNQHVGTDRIRRVGLEFLDRQAPGHLVPSEDRPSRATPPHHLAGSRGARGAPRADTAASPRLTPPPPRPPADHPPSTGPVGTEEILSALEHARARSHFEILGIAQTATDAEVRAAASGSRGGSIRTRRSHPRRRP